MIKILVTNTSLQHVSDLIVHPQGAVFCAYLKLYILHTKLVPVSVWQLWCSYWCVSNPSVVGVSGCALC
jgi:hypothetical protein